MDFRACNKTNGISSLINKIKKALPQYEIIEVGEIASAEDIKDGGRLWRV